MEQDIFILLYYGTDIFRLLCYKTIQFQPLVLWNQTFLSLCTMEPDIFSLVWYINLNPLFCESRHFEPNQKFCDTTHIYTYIQPNIPTIHLIQKSNFLLFDI
jgi:hypothetical protein